MPSSPQWRSDSEAVLFFAGSPELGLQQHSEQVISIADNRVVWWQMLDHGNVQAATQALNTHLFSPDGLQICTTFPARYEAKVSRISDATHVMTMQGQDHNVLLPESVQWAPDSCQVAACCSAAVGHATHDSFLGVWHVSRGRVLTVTLSEVVVSEPSVVISGDPMLQWAPDAKHLAVFVPTDSPYDCISIVSVEAHAPVCFMRTAAFALAPQFSMFELAWSPDASQMVVSFVHERAIASGINNGNGGNGVGLDADNGLNDDQQEFVSALVSFV
ncbi:hypothetical protein WJX73_007004 [Symbiochloris irregularis]|uniref:Uncharacterized protein n=1 Tax=Symbiochloris irregularis TaxID=706552 RepID=A0AAW1P429_9CHLO